MDPITLVGGISLFGLIAAAAGGLFGAAIGGNFAFGFVGASILLGLGVAAITDSAHILSWVAFGPVFGPHIAFAGGVAAAAYAYKKGYLESGRDVNTPLVSLDKPDVLLVGAGFGVFGYVLKECIAMIPWFGANTDAVALTVVTSGIVARILFSDKPVAKWASTLEGDTRWVGWQERAGQLSVLAVGSSILAAGIGLYVVQIEGVNAALAANAHTLPFALSALCIFFLALGAGMPVTHHITICAALAAVSFLPVVGGSMIMATVVAIVFGLISAFGAEFVQRLFYAHGDTHIDPPAGIIWLNTTLILGISGALAGAGA